MGKQQAQEFAEAVKFAETNLEAALVFHFRNNHYPPLQLELIPIAVKIIKGEISENNDIKLPAGISYRGQTSAPVSACIKAWHLDAFLQNPDDYEE